MQLVLLTHRPTRHTARRLLQAASALGHHAVALEPQRLVVAQRAVWDVRHRRVTARGIWWRPGGPGAGHALGVVETLCAAGGVSFGAPGRVAALVPGWRTLALLETHGVPVMPFAAAAGARQAAWLAVRLGAGPKLLTAVGARGDRLTVALGRGQAVTAAAQVLWRDGAMGELQPATPWRRLVVVGGAVLAATGLERGRVVRHRATPEEMRVAGQTSQLLGLPVMGMDVAGPPGRPKVAHVTAAPALEGAEAVCGVDLARPMVEAWVEWTRARLTRVG